MDNKKDPLSFACFKCRNKVETNSYETKINKRGRPYMSATCPQPNCSSKLSRFSKKENTHSDKEHTH